jgi:hexosaminidase
MLFLLASSLLLQQCRFGLAVDAIAPQLDVIPYPSGVALGAGASIVDPNEFVMTVGECSHDCDVLDRAVERYMKTIFKAPGSTGTVFRLSIFEDRINTTLPVGVVDKLSGLVIKTTSKKAVELQLGIDESYELTVPGAGDAVLTAHTVWGALRGLETFAQIVQYQAQPAIDTGAAAEPESGFYVNWTPLAVQDAPRFPWRGVLIDSARHYISVPMLRKTIDSMAAMKLNTLHWHIVDAESFPFVSEEFPELQRRATYHSSASYSPSTIRSLVKYARDRGVRVLPEFDTPGHTAAVGQAYPDLIADCYAWMVQHYDDNLRWPYFNNVALDVTKDTTRECVRTVVGEMAGLFPDSFFHVRVLLMVLLILA